MEPKCQVQVVRLGNKGANWMKHLSGCFLVLFILFSAVLFFFLVCLLRYHHDKYEQYNVGNVAYSVTGVEWSCSSSLPSSLHCQMDATMKDAVLGFYCSEQTL